MRSLRILFLTRSFNSLAQRLYLDLAAAGHELSVELDISDAVTVEAVALFKPDLVLAPFLKRAIPEAVWRHTLCLVVHPGIVGDRGPSALDWAIANGESEWGVTVIQAEAEMDAGPVWASATFAMRAASKSSLYRREVTEAASRAVAIAVQRFASHGALPPPPSATARRGRWRPLMRQDERRIDWQRDGTETVLRKLRAADGAPGVADTLFDLPCQLFDGHAELLAPPQTPGRVVARRHGAVLRTTVNGAVWIGHVQRTDQPEAFKLPTTLAFGAQVAALPDWPLALDAPVAAGWQDIRYASVGLVSTLHFDFYNGAMSTTQCRRLTAAVRFALGQPARVLLLLGGSDFWSNGLHLNVIEAAASPADESWDNINAMNDLTQTLIEATGTLVIAAMQGNAGAGGVFMALAADEVWARDGVVLNPHYKNMGNLYGSEYWTYLLPRRLCSGATAAEVMGQRLPVSATRAADLGLVDAVLPGTVPCFVAQALDRASALTADPRLAERLQRKQILRHADEARKPLAANRGEELACMRRNFYGFDPSYHIARSNFVRRVAHAWTPRHLARHRDRSP
jgi:putative two-component system protein, hydrogenase maturation factor HypX/HoxX